jgi:shikimate 5-dehydrogenase
MPHKIHIGKFCDRISEPAKAIGAINTLIISQDANSGQRMVTGENTDWSGLVESMKLSAPDVLKSAQTGLVIGAGGAARAALYALYQIGIRDIYLVNRTRANAEKITRDYAHLFRVMIVSSLFEVATTNGYRPDIIIGTIPADQTSVENFPETLFESGSGVCVDMSYKPRLTPLLKRASMAGGWVTVSGVSVLLEQGFLQSELWLRVPAPKDVMIRELEKHDRMTAEGMKV